MTKKLLRLTSNFAITEKAAGDDNETLTISGWANTTDKDRSGDVILEEAWSKGGLSDYLNNPIILGYHKHDNPIGKMVNHTVSAKGLFITAEISKAAGNMYNLIKEGVLKSFSVGFMVKDADYDSMTDIFVIKDLELMEVSVVSVPANQHSTFSVAKQFESVDECSDFKKGFSLEEQLEDKNKSEEANTEKDTIASKADDAKPTKTEILEIQMTPEEIQAAIAKGIADANIAAKALEVTEKAAADKAAASIVVGNSGVEKLVAELTKRFEDNEKSLGENLDGLRAELKEKSDEVTAMQKSKMQFEEKSSVEIARVDANSAVLLAKILGKSAMATTYAGRLLEKAPSDHHSALTQDWEQQFSTTLLADIRRQLVVEPLFRNIAMTSNKMHLPINPEAGYGQWIGSAAYNETAASTGTAAEHDITDTTLTAYKLAAKEYLGYEEEEDSIIPLLPIIQDAVTRRMAKSSDQAILRGLGSGASDPIKGICKLALDAGGDAVTTLSIGGADKATAAIMQTVRRGLGIRGLNPADVMYVVSSEVYYDLIEDADFRTVDKVGMPYATLLTGQVGSINGSPVIVSGEFDAISAGNAAAVAVNTANFIKGELRGLMMERDKNIEFQRNVLVASRRMGFIPIIGSVGASVLNYAA